MESFSDYFFSIYSDMYGSQRLMVNLRFRRIHGMSHLDVELRLDYILEMKLASTLRRVNLRSVIY